MGNIVKNYIKKFGDEHRLRNKRLCLLLALAVVVGGGVAWKLHYTGIALTNGTYCGFEEHIHDESCYEYVLICGMEEGALTEGEYEVTPGEDEASGGALEAELPEAHVHTDECYEKVLICDISEHIHTVECLNEEAGGSEASDGESGGGSAAEKTENGETAVLGDENADVETIEEIEASLPSEMSGIWAEDVAAAAESQLGYTESIYNFKLDDDGETHRGYTRYGAWYGNEYGEWNAMFAAFCLHYGGVSEDVFPVNGGAYSWTAVLTEAGLYKEAAGCSPSAGDLVFFDRDKDGKADSVGILTKTESLSEDEETGLRLYVIEGDYSVNENEPDGVYETAYDPGDESIIGFGILPPQTQTGGEKTMTCEGEGFTVSVTFGADAEIPEKAEFIAEEYEKDSETYIERFAEAAELYGWDEEDETEAETETETETEIPALIGELLSFEILTAEAETETQTTDDKFRLFSIGFYSDGEEIEPKGEVNVEITLTEAEADENTDSVSVVHFGEDSHEVLSAEAEYSDGVKTVKFSSESFSDYGIAAVSEEIALLASGEATPEGVYIEDCIKADGTFKAILYYENEDGEQVEIPYDEDAGYTYTWYQSNGEFLSTYRGTKMTYTDADAPEFDKEEADADDTGSYDVVDEPTVLSENTVNVAEDLGALRYYYVVVTDSGGYEVGKAVKYVEYSDQIENGSFEDSSAGTALSTQITPDKVPYWSTTDYNPNYYKYETTGVSSKIEIGYYPATITNPVTYGVVGMYAGNDSSSGNKYFAELNCQSYGTLYQDVLTAPGSNLNWNLYHHCRESLATTSLYTKYFPDDKDGYTVSETKTVIVESEDEEGKTIQTEAEYTYETYKYASNDVMCVVIMSTEDAEKLFSGIDLSEQETVLSAVRKSIEEENEDKGNGWTDKKSSDTVKDSPKSFGEITGSFKGDYTLEYGDYAGETITADMWRCSTVTVRTTVVVTDSDGNTNAADPTGSLVDDEGYVKYTTAAGATTYYKSTEWVNYSSDYSVPDNQYLTRFFFVAESATGGSSAGNFLDKVSFSQDIDYTIDYWVWDDEQQTYLLQSDDIESDTVEPYTIVTASNIENYADLALVGSVTGTASGGESPESFDRQTTRRIRVRASATHLSLYFKDTGASIIKELNGIPESRLSEVAEETYDVSFYYYNTADGEASGEEITLYANNGLNYNTTGYLDLDKGTYKIKETSYPVSLLNGDYIWVNVLVDGVAAEADSDGYYTFILDDGSATAVIYFTNVYEPAVRLKKTDSTTGSTLSGAEFVMYKTDSGTNYYFMSYNDDGSSNWSADKTVLTTDENGEINFGLLEDGTYYIEEITAPGGYNPLPEGSVLTFVVEDGAVDEKSVILKDGNGTQLEGMTDILLDSSDGTYQIVNLKNDPGVELPSTGGAGKLKYLSAGVMLLFGMACLMIINSRRRKERSD